MKEQKVTFESYVCRGILAHNEFGINQVNELISLKSMSLDRERYPMIVNLIKEGNFDAIKELSFGTNEFEYLEIMKFNDQNNNEYVVTVYSNDALEQDPQLIDVFRR